MAQVANKIYYHFIEPVLCVGYIWVMWRIKSSHSEVFRSAFYHIFVYAGLASCLNILFVRLILYGENILNNFALKDLAFNIIVFASHTFSLSHTIGKVLVIATRFTAIRYPLTYVWTTFRMKLSVALMFIIPAVLYSFMVPLKAQYRTNSDGVVDYIGVDVWAQEATFAQHERALLYYTIAITFAHFVKSAQQVFWFVAIATDNTPHFELATKMYNIANGLTTFTPPLLLFAMSALVRYAVTLGCLGRGNRYNQSILPLVSSTHNTTRDISFILNNVTPTQILPT